MKHRDKPDRPHILFLIDQLLDLGGAERVLFKTIELLPQDKFRCSLATFRGSAADLEDRVNCPVYVFPLIRTYDAKAFSVAAQLRYLIRSQHVDVVHTFFETSDLWGGLIAKLSGCSTLISTRRDMGILRSSKHKVGYRLMNPLFDCVLAVSDSVRDYCIREDRIDPGKVITLYNGIDLENVNRVRDMNIVPESLRGLTPLVTTVAHVRRIKGIEVFLQAAAITRRTFPQAKFLVVGDIWDKEFFGELQTLSRGLGLDSSVVFLGATEDVIPYLRISHLFCLLSHSEGFSNALLEAMACSLPCVVTQVGGNGEAIEDGESGFLVQAGDAETAAARIIELIANPARAIAMGQAARRKVEDCFTTRVMIERLTAIYDRFLSTTGNAGYSLAHTGVVAD
jgi:glycosyltransferase involved in cell wall biosynthesis